MVTPFIYFLFFLSKATLVTAKLPVSCNVFLFIFQQFCSNHFAMSVFIYEAFICNAVYVIAKLFVGILVNSLVC